MKEMNVGFGESIEGQEEIGCEEIGTGAGAIAFGSGVGEG
jgi:hypothetical protein